MGLYTELPSTMGEVDVIIVGGGTAGCIIAARLADADPGLSILLVEEGSNNLNNPTITQPAFCYTHIFPDSTTTKAYKSSPETGIAGRELSVTTGAVLGGGSSVNMMMYTRGQRSDYDAWNMPGWGAADLLPYMRKFETYHGPGPRDCHGYDGPIHVSDGRFRATRSTEDFIAASRQLSWLDIEDLQDLDSVNGVQRAMRYVSPTDGTRQDVAHRYIHPRLQDGNHPNLHVLVETQVQRLLFNGRRVSGIQCRPNSKIRPEKTESSVITARRLVVSSCGTFGSPLLLERSGIGSREVLERAKVPLVSDLPGVGNDYQDHQLLLYPYRSGLAPGETLDALANGRLNPEELMKANDGILSWNAQDITCKLRPSEAELTSLGPDFRAAWDRDFKDVPSRPLILLALLNVFPGHPGAVSPGQYIATSTFSVYPYSRGGIHISGTSIDDPPSFKTGFFSDEQNLDIKKHVWGYKAQREIVRRMACYRGEVEAGHPPFAPESDAACGERDGPLPVNEVKNISYSAEDDAVIEKWLRENVSTTWHSLGTCKMGSPEKMGVVDSSLGVYGVEGLKIADMSVPPLNVAANTANTALAIGEKAADIFIKELGLA
ncbi:alcohol oxidase-like protein [Xylariomycetidae sp. FL0641]|nr:alcohol oxidase-like protein [Xylariomycetidae sp. FL0641]